MSSDFNASPINPLPPVVVALTLLILGVELVFQAGNSGFAGGPEATGWRIAAIERWGFYPPMMDWMIENRIIRWDYLVRFISYPFVHGNFTHATFVLVFTLALGKMAGEAFRPWAVLVIFFGAAIAGAIAYGFAWDTRVILFGGFPPAYGLIGAYSFLMWSNISGWGMQRLQAFSLIAFLMGIQLVFGLFFGGGLDWVADLAGFLAGFGLSFFVSPGGWHNVVTRIRRS